MARNAQRVATPIRRRLDSRGTDRGLARTFSCDTRRMEHPVEPCPPRVPEDPISRAEAIRVRRAYVPVATNFAPPPGQRRYAFSPTPPPAATLYTAKIL